MHEEAIPILGVGEAAVSSEGTPTIGQPPARCPVRVKPC